VLINNNNNYCGKNIIKNIHRYFYIPIIMDRNLMRIILNLQADTYNSLLHYE